MKIFFLVVSFLCIIHPAFALTGEQNALFVSVLNKQPAFTTPAQIDELIAYAKKAKINVLFVQLYRANLAWFPSKMADDSPYRKIVKEIGQDPVALLIKKAHENGIEIHAWVNLLSLSQNKDAKILKKYGLSILTRNLEPKQGIEDYKIDNQYFLEPSDSRVRYELAGMVEEILTTYRNIDGIQFDYIRYPDVHPSYGYSPDNIKRFKKAFGQEPDEKNQQWRQWKRTAVTDLLKYLVKRAKTINPKIHASAIGCVSYLRAYEEAFQEWPLWVNTDIVEFVTMMNYPEDNTIYSKNITALKQHVIDFRKVNLTVGAYKFVHNPEPFKKQYDLCKQADARSCVIFHYNSLLENTQMADYLVN